MKRTVGQVIAAARKAHGLTQLELASRVGITEQYVTLIENGQRHPSLKLLGRLGKVLRLGKAALFLAYPSARQFFGSEPRHHNVGWINSSAIRHYWRSITYNRRNSGSSHKSTS